VNAARGGKRRRRAPPSGTTRSGQVSAPPLAAPADPQGVLVTWLPGTYEIPVAGLEHHALAVRDTLAAVARRAPADAALQPEPSNTHDANAVAVYMAGRHVGYAR
jgi:hypothetical protein